MMFCLLARHLPLSLAAITLLAKQDASDSASSQGEVRLVPADARFEQGGWKASSWPAESERGALCTAAVLK